jgi:mannose/cellobiose epimerase-like protein (N-acyl-D-glucosamine 2-epimerase family)
LPHVTNAAHEALDWLRNDALPLWLDKGVDRKRGGYAELLSLESAASVADYIRVRIVPRQIQVFAAAHRLGVPGARDAMNHGVAFLLGPCRHPGGGFVTRVDLSGKVLDSRRELYELAFVLFGLGHAYSVTRDAALRDEAQALFAFIKAHMTHPEGGYREALEPGAPNRRQNPHMHLLEAALVWTTLEPAGPWQALALELAGLFSDRFFAKTPGALIEFFDEALVPLPGAGGRITEPGHHFEWVWLLKRVEQVCGLAVPGGAALYAFAHRHGYAAGSGLFAAEVDTDGKVLNPMTRVWPHTEWMKAEAVTAGPLAEARLIQSWAVLKRMFDTPVRGLWHEHWDTRTGATLPGPSPASSFYHIMLALEVLIARAGLHPDPFGVA